jgi:hypothetical protein
VSVGQGGATSDAINISRTNFTAAVSLSVSGLPAGATATFIPNPATGNTSSLIVATSNCGTVTPRGTFGLTVSGTSSGLTKTTSLSLTVTNGAPKVTAPTSSLYTITTMGTTSSPVRTSWSACDADGVASYQLQRQVDGGSWATVSLASPTSTSISQSLTYGHTYHYRVLATDTLALSSGYATGSTIKPLATDQTSSLVTYSGTWTTSSASGAFGGSLRSATAAGASASYTFTGNGIAWTAYRGPTRGSANVYIDGVYRATVSLYTSTLTARKIVFAYSWTISGTHTIKITVVGTAGHPRVDVDAFVRLYKY